MDFAKVDHATVDWEAFSKSALKVARRFAQHIADEIEGK
jgi:hypothetical protein